MAYFDAAALFDWRTATLRAPDTTATRRNDSDQQWAELASVAASKRERALFDRGDDEGAGVPLRDRHTVGVQHVRAQHARAAAVARDKLSIVIQLSAPDDYTGGDLELFFADPAVQAPRGLGNAAAFPSFTMH
ncbi:MAG TPA: hypothetical protein VK427_13745, partial [Kofleriaceae bacterium]|nr:hypothetical protein [Kofleriaceae bacterium]